MLSEQDLPESRIETARFENLAGVQACDEPIRRELAQAGIYPIYIPTVRDEVPASTIGILTFEGKPTFVFSRAWYYWRVEGDVPIDAAREIYADPIGQKDVRVAGHAGRISPDEDRWTRHFDANGKILLTLGDKETLDHHVKHATDVSFALAYANETLSISRFVENPAAEAAKSTISSYHIDSQEGLNLFVATLRKYNIVS